MQQIYNPCKGRVCGYAIWEDYGQPWGNRQRSARVQILEEQIDRLRQVIAARVFPEKLPDHLLGESSPQCVTPRLTGRNTEPSATPAAVAHESIATFMDAASSEIAVPRTVPATALRRNIGSYSSGR